jgi:transmembrane sensor
MTESTQLTPPGDAAEIREQAARWLVRQHASAEFGDEDRIAFQAWMDESPAHMMAYWRLEAVWGRADRLSALRGSPQEAARPIVRQRRMIFFGTVGLCLLGAVIAVASFLPRTDGSNTYETALGGHKILTLGDGSKIELNTGTLIRMAAEGPQRKVWLERGEAFFQIKHDAAHPFVVVAGNRQVVDVGTAFAMRREPDRLQVTLTEGEARLEPVGAAHDPKALVLTPGDVAVATSGGIALTTRPVAEVSDQLAWRHGLLAFDSTPLGDVAAEFNRYNRQKLLVVGADARSVEVGGHFRATNVEAFKRMARNILKLHVETHGDETVISR